MEIVKIRHNNAKQIREFHNLVNSIYLTDENYVMPITDDVEAVLIPQKTRDLSKVKRRDGC